MSPAASTAPTAECAAFVTGVTYDELPEIVVERSKVAILDTIGVTLAGRATSTASAVQRFIAASGGPGRASVIGRSRKTDAASAAFVNGTTGHALDYDDVSWSMIGHPSVAVLPAVLAVAEDRGLGGREVIAAYAVGFEIAAKLGAALNPSHYARGWHATGTLGTLGAAAGVANLLRLDEHATTMALGIAASLACGLRQSFGTDTKPLHAGQAARNGVVAAQLAEYGFTAASDILESRWGVANVFADLEDDALVSVPEPGQPWEIAESGLLIKTYPSCVSTHTGIDTTLALRERHRLQPDAVEKVDVGVVLLSTKILIHNRPQAGLEGKFSMPYCVARALLDGEVKIRHFTDEAVNEPKAQALLRRVQMQVDPRVDEEWEVGKPRGAIVSITLTDGTQVTGRTDVPSGTGENLDPSAVVAKFHDCVGEAGLPDRAADDLVERLLAFDTETDVGELLTLACRD